MKNLNQICFEDFLTLSFYTGIGQYCFFQSYFEHEINMKQPCFSSQKSLQFWVKVEAKEET